MALDGKHLYSEARITLEDLIKLNPKQKEYQNNLGEVVSKDDG